MDSLPVETELLLDQTGLLLKQVLGAKVEIAEFTFLIRKHDYVVMLARVRHPSLEVILKLAGPNASIACPFEQTAFLHRVVAAQTTILMPEVFAADSSYQTWRWRYLVRACVSGVEWATVRPQLRDGEVADAHAQIGDAVAQLHNICLPAFGEFAVDGEVQRGKTYLQALRERAESTIQTQELRALFSSVLDQHADLFVDVGEAALCHEDLHRHNLLFSKDHGTWQLASILDFDKAWTGCPESDLARLELWDGMTSESFWQAYYARRAVSPMYEKRRPIYQLLWCFEYAKPTEKHLADTNRLCDKLGLPNIEHYP